MIWKYKCKMTANVHIAELKIKRRGYNQANSITVYSIILIV